MNKLARTGSKGDPTDTPINLIIKSTIETEMGTWGSKIKSYFNLCLVIFSCGLFSKISSTAISIFSCKVMLVKRLQTSYETKK